MMKMTFEELMRHFDSDCIEAISVDCINCKISVKRANLEKHLLEDCTVKHTMECPYCQAQIVFRDLREHQCIGLLGVILANSRRDNLKLREENSSLKKQLEHNRFDEKVFMRFRITTSHTKL